ncbi:hypothetical protein MPH47_01490 [Psychrobacillus psychrodurans]|uniref:hypothetical protein n=1 Tax=Psychrobacillus psychrodurans TaxID=126157 RepID=UPI001F4EFE05|nr:hypothetical protein [Psychrobacillus psychrodurans]MCK1995908.1 hypothetical protein [Psychrobacillus psychrodurans]
MNNTKLDHIKLSYLNLESPQENRSGIVGYFLILLYVVGIIPILGVPFSLPFFLAAIIPITIIQLWAIVYLIDPYKYEKSYYLFFGIYGAVNTYVYFLVILKLIYINMEWRGSTPLITNLVLFILLLGGINWLNWKALYSGTYYKLQQKRTIPVVWTAIGGSSYIIGQIILSFIYSDSALSILFIVGISILSLCTAFFTINIHRYFFINKNIDIVKQRFPEFGLPKSDRYTEQKKKKKKRKKGKE